MVGRGGYGGKTDTYLHFNCMPLLKAKKRDIVYPVPDPEPEFQMTCGCVLFTMLWGFLVIFCGYYAALETFKHTHKDDSAPMNEMQNPTINDNRIAGDPTDLNSSRIAGDPTDLNRNQCMPDLYEDKCQACMCDGGPLWCNAAIIPDGTKTNGCQPRKGAGETCGQQWECLNWDCYRRQDDDDGNDLAKCQGGQI